MKASLDAVDLIASGDCMNSDNMCSGLMNVLVCSLVSSSLHLHIMMWLSSFSWLLK